MPVASLDSYGSGGDSHPISTKIRTGHNPKVYTWPAKLRQQGEPPADPADLRMNTKLTMECVEGNTHTLTHTRTENWWQDVAWSIKYMYGIYKTIIGMEVVDGQSLVSRWRLICIFLPKSHNCTTWGCTWQTLIPVCEHALNWMSSAKRVSGIKCCIAYYDSRL